MRPTRSSARTTSAARPSSSREATLTPSGGQRARTTPAPHAAARAGRAAALTAARAGRAAALTAARAGRAAALTAARAGRAAALTAALGATLGGCDGRSEPRQAACAPLGSACASTCDARPPTTLLDVTPAAGAAGAHDVHVSLMLATSWPPGDAVPRRDDLERWVGEALERTAAVLGQCGLGLQAERVELVAVPATWLKVRANTERSWAGLAPEGQDPEDFNYALGERLTDEARRLFVHARRGLPARTITVVVVDEVRYFAAQKPARAGALSFPPTVYHHPDDYPARNGVLIGSSYPRCGAVPTRLSPRVIAHELGHMLLDVAHHEEDKANLMSTLLGERVTEAQCDRMRTNLARLYGERPVVDPRAP